MTRTRQKWINHHPSLLPHPATLTGKKPTWTIALPHLLFSPSSSPFFITLINFIKISFDHITNITSTRPVSPEFTSHLHHGAEFRIRSARITSSKRRITHRPYTRNPLLRTRTINNPRFLSPRYSVTSVDDLHDGRLQWAPRAKLLTIPR